MQNRLLLWMFVLLTLYLGCTRPPPPKFDDLYRGRSEDLPRLDPSLLAGRTILIDPGHGGYFAGTRGQEGLAEARVNLGVSLYLWGLLKEAGADAHLTRSSERDFLTPEDSTLVNDLGWRVAIVDSLQPDIMVSIHHNAQPERDPTHNGTETYYRFGDPSSRDLAFAVHRHLMRNLGIDFGEVRPGNYYILRNVDIPAILGEGSYLTHPKVEENLKLSDKQELEAQAYFLGILEYFSRGTPRLARSDSLDSVMTDLPTLVFATEDVGGLGIDPGAIDLRVNDRSVIPWVDARGDLISYQLPADAPNGDYDVTLGVRNVLGNSSSTLRREFRVDLPPEAATFETSPARISKSGGTIRMRARLLDRRGMAVADGTPVQIRSENGTVPDSSAVRDGVIEFPVRVPPNSKPYAITVLCRGRQFKTTIDASAETTTIFREFTIADTLSNRLVENATILYGDSLVVTGSNTGTYYLPVGGDGEVHVTVRAPGYKPLREQLATVESIASDTLHVSPWYNGLLVQKRFMIDPEGGFGSESGVGDLGLTGAYVNLKVAQYLEEYLEAAGAIVELTRRNEETLSPRDVVAVTNRFGADRYIEIRHRNEAADSGLVVDAYYFPGSRGGAATAESVQKGFAEVLGLAVRAPREIVTFPLQQTACPAIVVAAPSIGVVDEELRLAEPWYQRRQAYGIFLGIVLHYGLENGEWLRISLTPAAESANWLARLDETWTALSSPSGDVSFFLPPEERAMSLEFRRGGRYFSRTLTFDGPGAAIAVPTVP